jgi:hypothetical protein
MYGFHDIKFFDSLFCLDFTKKILTLLKALRRFPDPRVAKYKFTDRQVTDLHVIDPSNCRPLNKMSTTLGGSYLVLIEPSSL